MSEKYKCKYYESNLLEFVGTLYCKIESGVFNVTVKSYNVPINTEKKKELASRGVPAIFITDLK